MASSNYFRAFTGLALLALVFWLLSFALITFFYGNPEGAGEAGDTFGAINALFAGLGLSAAAGALLLQVKQSEEATKANKETAAINGLCALVQAAESAMARYNDQIESKRSNQDSRGLDKITQARERTRKSLNAYRRQLDLLVRASFASLDTELAEIEKSRFGGGIHSD
ncbi:MAG: hypothetical protein Q7J29_02375 [Stagnimonas sp.]|nr:hypothetical protein [Stagnimonas sp.]